MEHPKGNRFSKKGSNDQHPMPAFSHPSAVQTAVWGRCWEKMIQKRPQVKKGSADGTCEDPVGNKWGATSRESDPAEGKLSLATDPKLPPTAEALLLAEGALGCSLKSTMAGPNDFLVTCESLRSFRGAHGKTTGNQFEDTHTHQFVKHELRNQGFVARHCKQRHLFGGSKGICGSSSCGVGTGPF